MRNRSRREKPTWQLATRGGSKARLEGPRQEAGRLRVAVASLGHAEAWDLQLDRFGLRLQAGRSYRLRFRGRADASRPVAVGVARAHEPWTGLGLYASFELGPEWQPFAFEFDAEADEDDARIHFDLGGSSADVELEAVVLEEAHWKLEVRPPARAARIFEEDSEETLRIEIQAGAEVAAKDIQLNSVGFSVRKGTRRAVLLRARADAPRTIVLGVAGARKPWPWLGLHRTLEIGPEWQSFLESFEPNADEPQARIHIDLGGSDVSVEVADVELRESCWQLLVSGEENAARLVPLAESETGVRVAVGKAQGEAAWEIQLSCPSGAVETGAGYALEFRGRSDAPRWITLGVTGAERPWKPMGLHDDADLTPEWRPLEVHFSASGSAEETRIHFDLGVSDADVELDNPRLVRQVFRREDGPKRPYVLCATPRCGSNLVSEALWRQRKAGRPQEYFLYWHALENERESLDPEAVLDWILPTPEYVEKVIEQGSTPNGVFGFKLMQSHFDLVVERLRELHPRRKRPEKLLDAVFPGLRYVHVVRRDKLRQAISLTKALQSGQWYRMQRDPEQDRSNLSRMGVERVDFASAPAAEEVAYDFEGIRDALELLEREDESWLAYFERTGVSVHRVFYEDLVESYAETVRGVLEYLEVPLPHDVRRSQGLRRQSDVVNEEWRSRFLAEREQRES